jgi:hypothetical protein
MLQIIRDLVEREVERGAGLVDRQIARRQLDDAGPRPVQNRQAPLQQIAVPIALALRSPLLASNRIG